MRRAARFVRGRFDSEERLLISGTRAVDAAFGRDSRLTLSCPGLALVLKGKWWVCWSCFGNYWTCREFWVQRGVRGARRAGTVSSLAVMVAAVGF